MVKTKCVYAPREGTDGVRVLVTRYWPRGVRKESADHWFKELGTAPELIKKWKAGLIAWDKFSKAYIDEYRSNDKQSALGELKAIVKGEGKGTVTLLCACKEDEHCHRSILKAILDAKIKV